jgi:hypothetical protein
MPKVAIWVPVHCANCGKEFSKRESDIARKRTNRFFCSKPCQFAVGSKPRTRTYRACATCAKVFYPTNDASLYCSAACKSHGQRKNPEGVPCEYCGTPHRGTRNSRFCSRQCWISASYQRPLDRMHNGKPAVLDNSGYVIVYEPEHPNASPTGWFREHRLVVERALGRLLASDEHVHHRNHIRHDNRPEKLQALSHSEHSAITGAENGEALRVALELRQKLQEYESRFGPLNPR